MRAKEGWRAAWLESSLGMEGKEWRASKTKCVDVSHKGYPKSQPIEDRGRKDSELNISLGYTVRPCLHRKKNERPSDSYICTKSEKHSELRIPLTPFQ